jgi:cell division protein ZipA
MQANWNLILNVLLLIGVVVGIGRIMMNRRSSLNPEQKTPAEMEKNNYESQDYDDVIAVRKINVDSYLEDTIEIADELPELKKNSINSVLPRLMPENEENIELRKDPKLMPKMKIEDTVRTNTSSTVMMFLLTKENRQFAGYELLQTVLACGLRFGDDQIFHRHQFINGQGPILCSLAAATPTGVFDLQNIGTFCVHGLCLYMHLSRNPGIDIERFTVMLETARQLSEGLDAHLLDDQRNPLTEESIARYHRLLQANQSHLEPA